MLPAIEADHLSGDRAVLDEVADGTAKLGELGPTAEWKLLDLAAKLGVVLPDIGNRGTGRNPVDPHARRQSLRQRNCCRRQRRLRDLVGEKPRSRAPDALVNEVDDVAFDRLRQ